MLQDLTPGMTVQSLGVQLAAIAAGIVVLKQWIRSDVTRLERALETTSKANDEQIDSVDKRLSEAMARMAETVDRFVQTTTEERFRLQEQTSRWERELSIKVASLEVTVAGMSVTLSRIGEIVNKFTTSHEHGAA